MSKILNIFEFSDYRRFLKKWLEEAKVLKTSNVSRLAEVAQVHSTFLSHVLSGAKELSLEQAALIAQHMGLTKLEQEYFFLLVQLDRAGNQTLKSYLLERKKEIESEKNKLGQRFEKHRQLNNEQRATFYSSWIYAAVWSSLAIEKGQTLTQISERFNLSRPKAQEIISFFLSTGLCDDHNGVFKMGEVHIHLENASPLVVKHHTNWRVRGIQRMDNRDSSELFFSCPMSIAEKDFHRIREKLNVIVKEVIDIAKDSEAEKVVCLNIDFFNSEKV